MKKQAINFSWPAGLSDFSTDTKQENFSRGKLKVFYKGETADHRFFSDKFSEELVQTLPYTPVVGFYDEEKEDFVGHATEQEIFGVVDPCTSSSFEKDDDGNTWCVCDVVLYTERPDHVGDLAKKIIGHKQSLELDPNSVKYVVNYDEKKHFKNIEFTAGRFVGVSVLGNDQKPAFSGSEFFSYDEKFEAKMKLLKDYCENKQDQTQRGGENMNLSEFMKLSWGDISLKVNEAICKEYENDAFVSIVDMFSDSAIVRFYYYMEGTSKLMRIGYSFSEDGQVTLGGINEVHVAYEDIVNSVSTDMTKDETNIEQAKEADAGLCATKEESDSSSESESTDKENCECGPCDDKDDKEDGKEDDKDDVEDCACGDKKKCEEKSDCACGDKKKCEKSECPNCPEKDKDPEDCVCGGKKKEDCEIEECACGDKKKCEDEKDDKCKRPANHPDVKPGDPLPEGHPSIEKCEQIDVENPAQDVNVEIAPNTNMKVSVDDEQKSIEETSSSTSFTESERAEFETLKREKKIALVNSYKESLEEEEFNEFMNFASQEETTEEQLELKLLKAYKRNQESSVKPMRAFATFAPKNVEENSLDAFVRKNMRK